MDTIPTLTLEECHKDLLYFKGLKSNTSIYYNVKNNAYLPNSYIFNTEDNYLLLERIEQIAESLKVNVEREFNNANNKSPSEKKRVYQNLLATENLLVRAMDGNPKTKGLGGCVGGLSGLAETLDNHGKIGITIRSAIATMQMAVSKVCSEIRQSHQNLAFEKIRNKPTPTSFGLTDAISSLVFSQPKHLNKVVSFENGRGIVLGSLFPANKNISKELSQSIKKVVSVMKRSDERESIDEMFKPEEVECGKKTINTEKISKAVEIIDKYIGYTSVLKDCDYVGRNNIYIYSNDLPKGAICVIAYLMKQQSMNLYDAYKLVKDKDSSIDFGPITKNTEEWESLRSFEEEFISSEMSLVSSGSNDMPY